MNPGPADTSPQGTQQAGSAVRALTTFEYSPESQFPGDEHPLHLRGSLADLEHLGVAVEAPDSRARS